MPRRNVSQTRLPFTPLPSSPAKGSPHHQREQRLAVIIPDSPSPSCYLSDVRYNSKGRGLRNGQIHLLTPVASSQTRPEIEKDHYFVSPKEDRSSQAEFAGRSTKNSSSQTGRVFLQTKHNKTESSPQKSTDKATTESRSQSGSERGLIPKTPQRGRGHGAIPLDSSTEEDSDPVPTRSNRARRNTDVSSVFNEGYICSNPGTPSRASNQRRRNQTPRDTAPTRAAVIKKQSYNSSTRRTRASMRMKTKLKEANFDSESGSDRGPIQARLASKRLLHRPTLSKNVVEPLDQSGCVRISPSSDDGETSKFASVSAPASEARERSRSSDDEVSKPSLRRLGATSPNEHPDPPLRTHGRSAKLAAVTTSASGASEHSSDDVVYKHSRKRPGTKMVRNSPKDYPDQPLRKDKTTPELGSITNSLPVTSEFSSDDVVLKPSRRKLGTKMAQTSLNKKLDLSAEQVADLQEDLEDLRENEIHTSRTRDRLVAPTKNAKQKHLETLRRRHAGDKQVELPPGTGIVPLTPGSPKEGSAQSSEYEASDEDLDSATEAVRRSLYADADEYEEDFIDNDVHDGLLGSPMGLEDIPIEFTRHANKEPIEHFKDVVEWMVHNKLNPAFARNDGIYQIAVRKIDDEVQAYAGSNLVSSIWSPQFTKALKTRPDIEIREVSRSLGRDSCDACNRGRHPARYLVILSGRAYDRATLEEISEDDDEAGNDVESAANDPDEAQIFYLGSMCAANANNAHVLHHWRLHLNFFVLKLLKAQGHLSDQKILERASWSIKKNEKCSNSVVDEMEATGAIHKLYEEFQENQEAARSAPSGGRWAH